MSYKLHNIEKITFPLLKVASNLSELVELILKFCWGKPAYNYAATTVALSSQGIVSLVTLKVFVPIHIFKFLTSLTSY